MNALTIEQLKALQVDDWVWIDFGEDYIGKYCRKIDSTYKDYNFAYETIWTKGYDVLSYDDYGTKWVAYKNKEEATGEYDSRIEQAKKQTAKEILQDFYNQANNVWQAIEWTTEDIKQYAKDKHNVEVDE